MRSNRRGFLRLLGAATALVLGRASTARAGEGAIAVHRATRNTRLGALRARLGAGGPLPPFKTYPGAERVELPADAPDPSLSLAAAVRRGLEAGSFRPDWLSLAELGRLLVLTNGAKKRRRRGDGRVERRAAPSAGALYAGEVYVVAERIRGLPPGVYYYAVSGHALVRLRTGAWAADAARSLERPWEIEKAAALILLTNVFARYGRRYGARGYRYALIDSGHIGENLRLAAISAGLATRAPFRFEDDRLHALLQIDGRTEAVCALHALGRATDAAPEARPAALRLVERQHALGRPALDGGTATERYHEATKLVPAPAPQLGGHDATAPRDSSAGPASARSTHAEQLGKASAAGIALPPPTPGPATSAEVAIRRRCSAGGFAPEPLGLEELAFVLEMAHGHSFERQEELDIRLAVHRVAGLPAGLYRHVPGGRRLVLARRAEMARALTEACLGQELAAEAAAAFLVVGRIEAAAARSGARSYRDLLLESGAIGERVYLAAAASGLVARNLAAFWDDDLNALLGLDGRREAVLHLILLGRRRARGRRGGLLEGARWIS